MRINLRPYKNNERKLMKNVLLKSALLSLGLYSAQAQALDEFNDACDENAKRSYSRGYYLDGEGKCRSDALHCQDGFLTKLEVLDPPAPASKCGK
jgi:hypothetical protein